MNYDRASVNSPRTPFLGSQAMYACVHDIGRGFIAGYALPVIARRFLATHPHVE